MKRYSLLLFFLLIVLYSSAQQSLLQSGPMVGYSQMKEVLLWVQTTEPATVHFEYWEKGKEDQKNKTAQKLTTKAEAFTAKLLADQLEPGMAYEYDVFINDQLLSFTYPTEFHTQALWQWRTDPPNFKLAIGSCAYVNETRYDRPGKPYGGNYEIFEAIHGKRPDAMIWMGDNTYLREVDWFSETGIMHRYTHTRSLPEMQPLLASTHHYAIWDDHDFGPNDSDRSFIHKDLTTKAFELFWGNPSFGLPHHPGITTFFQFSDMEFFLIDNRYFRKPNRRSTGENILLGEAQIQWLIDGLANSRAPFKFVVVGGQFLNTYEGYENFINVSKEERAYILSMIEQEGIKNVIFLTGDRHHSELSAFKNGVGNMIYDITVSPLTAGAARNPEKDNKLRVENTLVTQRNFGILEFSGPRDARKMTVTIFDVSGEELWSKVIESQSE